MSSNWYQKLKLCHGPHTARKTVELPLAFLLMTPQATARVYLTPSTRCSGAENFLIWGWITRKLGAKYLVARDQYHVRPHLVFFLFVCFLFVWVFLLPFMSDSRKIRNLAVLGNQSFQITCKTWCLLPRVSYWAMYLHPVPLL